MQSLLGTLNAMQNIWYDIQIPRDYKLMSFRDPLYKKPNTNLGRLRKPDTNHR